jgi:hypothetical protein
MRRILWTVAVTLATSGFCSAQNTIYIPQVANGFDPTANAWISAIAIENTAALGTALASGTIALTKDNGTPWSLVFNDEQNNQVVNGSSIPFQIAGGQSRVFVTTGFGSAVTTGFATVTSNVPVVAGVVFIQFSSVTLGRLAQAGVPGSAALTRQATIVSKSNSEDTGVAVANPSNSTVTITFQLRDKNGAPALPAATRTVPAQGHTSFFVSQLFPNLTSNFFGTLEITSTTPIAATALLFDGPVFGTLPVNPLQ